MPPRLSPKSHKRLRATVALLLSAAPVSAHTDALGFACVQRSRESFDVTICFGSWHGDEPAAEGALSLFAAPAATVGDALVQYASYTDEAYGHGGATADQTNAFQDRFDVDDRLAWQCSSCGWPDAETRGYTEAEIEAVGFAWGVNYWYSDGGGLHAQRPDGAREIYKHQCVTIGGVSVGTYRIDYDDDPAGATSKANLTANWEVTGGVQQALFTVACNGTVVAGHAEQSTCPSDCRVFGVECFWVLLGLVGVFALVVCGFLAVYSRSLCVCLVTCCRQTWIVRKMRSRTARVAPTGSSAKTTKSRPPVADPTQLPRQIHLSGQIQFQGHKAGGQAPKEEAFRNAKSAERILHKAAEEYVQVLRKCERDGAPWPALSVEGHTSGEPDGHDMAVRVSEARATLCAKCIAAEMARRCPDLDQKKLRERIVAVGYGASKPLPGFDVGNHLENRRVEVFLRDPAQAPKSAWS